jgi:8-oxo-dGTP diphosphatase
MAGHWEFPGGKAEPGETASDALRREIAEELDCAIEVGREVVATTHVYPFATIRLTTYLCTLVSGTPTPVEHAELRWLAASALTDVTWAPADIPAVDAVRAILATATEG